MTAEGSLQDDTESYAEEAFEARDFLGGKWSYCIGNGHIGAEGYLHWVFYWRVFFRGQKFVCQLKINYRQLVKSILLDDFRHPNEKPRGMIKTSINDGIIMESLFSWWLQSFFNFQPEPWGNDSQFDEHIFQIG